MKLGEMKIDEFKEINICLSFGRPKTSFFPIIYCDGSGASGSEVVFSIPLMITNPAEKKKEILTKEREKKSLKNVRSMVGIRKRKTENNGLAPLPTSSAPQAVNKPGVVIFFLSCVKFLLPNTIFYPMALTSFRRRLTKNSCEGV